MNADKGIPIAQALSLTLVGGVAFGVVALFPAGRRTLRAGFEHPSRRAFAMVPLLIALAVLAFAVPSKGSSGAQRSLLGWVALVLPSSLALVLGATIATVWVISRLGPDCAQSMENLSATRRWPSQVRRVYFTIVGLSVLTSFVLFEAFVPG